MGLADGTAWEKEYGYKKPKSKQKCPKCQSHNLCRKIIGTEFETFCNDCEFWDSSDKFKGN